jgi:branched-chain amino acid transport system permease protein
MARVLFHRDFILDMLGLVLLVPFLFIPLITSSPLANSLSYQIVAGVTAAMGIYIMLRLGLVSFMVPAFMAIGGYGAALAATGGSTNLFLLMAVSAVIPAVVAIPLGALVLRLRGIYFIFVTFICNEILQILLFEMPGITGGANGIPGVPPASLFSLNLGTPTLLVVVSAGICVVATTLTLAVTHRFRPEFSSIEENETLVASLGVAAWKYRTIGFVASAAISGLAGFLAVNMLATAHPSMFQSWSVNNYIAYVFIGGRGSILGVVIGSALLILMSNMFSGYAQLSAGMFGLLLIVVMIGAPTGLVGTMLKRGVALRERLGRSSQPVLEERKG